LKIKKSMMYLPYLMGTDQLMRI